jgi:thioredoxin-dependent peroxiredoxin
MVELRKRPAPAPAPLPPRKKAAPKPKGKGKKEEPAAAVEEAPAEPAAPASTEAAPEVQVTTAATMTTKIPHGQVPNAGESIELDGFGGEVETNDGSKTTLAALVKDSKAGVVLFTYPKASTPGCE